MRRAPHTQHPKEGKQHVKHHRTGTAERRNRAQQANQQAQRPGTRNQRTHLQHLQTDSPTDLLRLQSGNLNLTTLNNGKKRERLGKARKLKVEVEQHTDITDPSPGSMPKVHLRSHERHGKRPERKCSRYRSPENVKNAQDVLERLRGEWEALEDGE